MREAGTLDRLIKLQTGAKSAGGVADVIAYTDAGEVWAERIRSTPTERGDASQRQATSSSRWQIRYRDDIDAKCRFEYPVDSGAWFYIVGTEELGRQDRIELTAEARADR